jgi:hypothetical protein
MHTGMQIHAATPRAFMLAGAVLAATAASAWAKQSNTTEVGAIYDQSGLTLQTELLPQLEAKIPALLVHKGHLLCDQGGKTCVINGLPSPLLKQDDNRIDDALFHDQKKGGCYGTAIVTIMHTALQNRAPAVNPLTGRTKDFFAEEKDPLDQLRIHYRQQKDGNVFYFYELVDDLGGGKIAETCDPHKYTSCDKPGHVVARNGNAWSYRKYPVVRPRAGVYPLTDADFTSLLNSGVYPLIGYHYYLPKTVSYDAKTDEVSIELEDHHTWHKVAVSGYEPGAHPLLIDNPGNGKRVEAHITTDLAEAISTLSPHGWGEFDPALAKRLDPPVKDKTTPHGDLPEIKKAIKVKITPEWLNGRPIVVYREPKNDKKGFAFNFVEQVDLLYVWSGGPKLDWKALPANIARLP